MIEKRDDTLVISVVLCTYNGEKFIEEQLNSILQQSRPVDEIIVLDDGSTDHTVEIAGQILSGGDVPYQIVSNLQNLGVTCNFEKGIRLSSGDIVLTSDQDDVWMKTKAADFEMLFKNTPDCVLAFSDACVTGQDLTVKQESLWAASGFNAQKRTAFKEEKYYEILFSDNVVTGAAMAVRRDFALSCISAPEGTLHDYWYALCAPIYGRIVMLEQCELLYRQHGRNVMGAPRKGIKDKWNRWKRTVGILKNDRVKRATRSVALKRYYDVILDSGTDVFQKEQFMAFKKQIDDWNRFSEWRESLNERSVFTGIGQIIIHAAKGEYKKYVNKKGIILQEILNMIGIG